MQLRPWLKLILFLGQALLAQAQPIFPNLQGQELLNAIVLHYKPSTVLSYSEARDTMYANIYKVNDSVACVYSGHRLFLPPDIDPSAYLSQNGSNSGINCEHTYPQSKGASTGNPESDMHHLFPTRAGVNTARDNFPFAEIPDEQSTQWYYLDEVLTDLPSSNLALYSERKAGAFEPREDHKGNVARAMFYFYTMYKEEADAADPLFFANQQQGLCEWHFLDPADSLEVHRSWQIASYQDGLANPFVLDCTLASRIYCQDTQGECPSLPSATQSAAGEVNGTLVAFPNPVKNGFFQLIVQNPGVLEIINGMGTVVRQIGYAPEDSFAVGELPDGLYFLRFHAGGKVQFGKIMIEYE